MNDHKIALFFRDALIVAFGVFIAAFVLGESRIRYDDFLSLFFAAIVISLLNAFLRPILISFALPLLLTSFGIGASLGALKFRSIVKTIFTFFVIFALLIWFVNALIFKLADVFAGNAFVVNGFGSALLGSIFTSLATLFICFVFGIKRQNVYSQIFKVGAGTPLSTETSASGTTSETENSRERRNSKESADDVIAI